MTAPEYPFIHIEQRPNPDDPTGFNLDVKAGNGIDSTDHLVTILLLAIDIVRRAAVPDRRRGDL